MTIAPRFQREPTTPHRPRVLAIAACGVLLLHLLFGLMLLRSYERPVELAGAPGRVTLRLLPDTSAVPVSRPSQPLDRRADILPTPRLRPAEPITMVPLPSLPGTVTGEAAAAPEPPASEPPRPLNLSLPRGNIRGSTPRNPALDDPRANQARPSLGERMARTLGTDRTVIEEDLGDGRRRIRQGTNCVISRPNRAAQLDPFSGRMALNSVEPCP